MTPTVAQSSNVQVLNMSLPRTGSFSMKAAYEELGMPTYHGFVYIERPQDHLRWFDAVQAKYYGNGKPFTTEDFNELVGEWAVVSDNPAIGFAKVVLVYRDLDKWYKSYDEGVIRSFFTWKMWAVLNLIEPLQTLKPVTVTRDLQYAMFRCSNRTQWQRNAKLICQEHSEKIRELVPKESLLEYKLGSGWEPLCKFLGKEIPHKPFPHLNDGKDLSYGCGISNRGR
ncbi:endonuclease exonuclease phosphatase family protein [Colletotrichum scovillei]|uniref:endonuclease exonuclease phosphatase family protein n=1 Tax=Colletotrichum scovillei TaxID=1209932 RepID=UPI0015C3C923|nr:endonuclease exonuclease phosphatase family protein [Colletotrichum scovillei]KAF4779697.1 endonuclease exonuclease phosphatase family protein [Colletotrichum scovillei]